MRKKYQKRKAKATYLSRTQETDWFCPQHPLLTECIAAGGITVLILWVLYALKGYAPFGEYSLACMDADIQYMDFFSWFKNVLSGTDSISYSFTKVLGGTDVGVYSYYLASPFTLLVVFFQKSQLETFFDLAVSLKLMTAAVCCAAFLHIRFADKTNQSLWRRIALVMLSISYALGQYSIAQASNIPWLDGVYMLPLILLGVYRLVKENKGILLSITVACSILFNWYTGGINCLFAILWFLFEAVLRIADEGKNLGASIKTFGCGLVRFGFHMAVGVLLSGILFLPTIGAMQKSTRGTLEIDLLEDTSLIGSVLTAVEAYFPGAKSTYGKVSLYAGSLPLLGCIGFFLCRKQKNIKKWVYGILFVIVLLLFYWNPLYVVFSLLKEVGSYWYRYSYLGIMTLIFISADFFLCADPEEIRKHSASAAAGFALLLLMLSELGGSPGIGNTYRTIFLVFVCTACLSGCIWYFTKRKSIERRHAATVCLVSLMLFGIETSYGVSRQMDNYHTWAIDEYSEYVQNEEQQISEIQEQDDDFYRISQTSTRYMSSDNVTAYYQDAMAYNYWSISGYTSSPDTVQLEFLDRLGYRQNGENFAIVNTSILGTDSLLGVKYVLSKYPVNGLSLREDLTEQNGKAVYENPYALPMAFTYEQNTAVTEEPDGSDPFLYQNALYSQLYGTDADLYQPLDYTVETGDNGALIYTVDIPVGNFAVYGNLPWDSQYTGTVNVNGAYETRYAAWVSPSVFYIPTEQGNSSGNVCTVTVTSDKELSSNGKEQFYALNLDLLEEVTSALQKNEAATVNLENGNVQIEAEVSGNDSSLFVSVPYDDSWEITRNGEVIEPDLIGDCLYSIPLEDGKNVIQMIYHVKYLYAGIVSSILGILLLAVCLVLKKRKMPNLLHRAGIKHKP